MLLFTGQTPAIPAGSLLLTVADHRLPLVAFVVVAVTCACWVWRATRHMAGPRESSGEAV
ncbi:MAG: hypothetical protein GEV10_03780 [Streptosporangiales bacterium]|nr:hypothetical protein [Streptosporangiales bacterium]